jgi:hypothetical protein
MRLLPVLLLLAICTGYALWKGGKPERAAAIVLLLMAISDPFVHVLTPATYIKVDPGHFIIDLAGWFALFYIAIRARRLWPLWISSLQTISLISHVTRLLDYTLLPAAYAIMQVSSSYLLLVVLTVGTYNHQARVRMNLTDQPWRN